jgi:hypothetical protein
MINVEDKVHSSTYRLVYDELRRLHESTAVNAFRVGRTARTLRAWNNFFRVVKSQLKEVHR